ncbi:MAG: DUF1361 domain-containing protein [Bacteroidota bacterium]
MNVRSLWAGIPAWMKLLCLCITGSCLLLAARVGYTGELNFLFLVWNLFLAGVPLLFSFGLSVGKKSRPIAIQWMLVGVWLAFFPNSSYILTDLFHLTRFTDQAPLWFDLLMLLAFSFTGLLMGYFSLYQIHQWLKERFSTSQVYLLLLGIMGATGFGLYLGRFQRWNSWDLITRPLGLLEDIAAHVLLPWEHIGCWGFTFGFGAFLAIGYTTFVFLVEGRFHSSEPVRASKIRSQTLEGPSLKDYLDV